MTEAEKLLDLAGDIGEAADRASELAEAAEDAAEAGKTAEAKKKLEACKAALARALARYKS
jgi:hypothetical protein